MEQVHGVGAQSDLLGVVRGVRARWRLKHALRGLTITIALSFSVYVVLAFAVKGANYADGAVITARLVSLLALLFFGVWFVIRPLLPKVANERVALYLEEHEPSLEGALVTAVEMDAASRSGVAPRSAGLAQLL